MNIHTKQQTGSSAENSENKLQGVGYLKLLLWFTDLSPFGQHILTRRELKLMNLPRENKYGIRGCCPVTNFNLGRAPHPERDAAWRIECCASSVRLHLAITWSLPRGAEPGVTSGCCFLAESTLPPNSCRRAGLCLCRNGRTSCMSQLQEKVRKAEPPPQRQHASSPTPEQEPRPQPQAGTGQSRQHQEGSAQQYGPPCQGERAQHHTASPSQGESSYSWTCTRVKNDNSAFSSAVLLIN